MEPPVEPPLAPEWKYWAFISYSHRDRQWADWLHVQSESFRIPKRLVGQAGRDATVPARVFPSSAIVKNWLAPRAWATRSSRRCGSRAH